MDEVEEKHLRQDPILSAKHTEHEEPRPEFDTASEISRHEEDAQNNTNSSISRHERVTFPYKEWEENIRLLERTEDDKSNKRRRRKKTWMKMTTKLPPQK